LLWQNHTLGPSTDAVCLNYYKTSFIGLWRAVFACDAPKMASNLAYDGLLAIVKVLGLIKRLSTSPQEVVVPENLI
jgi:hypothetical protein